MSTENDEEVNIEFDVDDKVSPKLSKMEKAVLRVGGAVDRASSRFTSMAASFAGLAGFFALGPAIEGAQNYIDHLDKMSDLTGIAADRVGGISNALEDAGVSLEGVDAVMSKLVKKTAQAGEGNKALAKLAKRYGVALKEGPESTLLAVSGLMEKGKLNAGQMQRILGVSSTTAADMADAMSMGPEELAKKIDEATKKNAAFNDEAMDGMQRYKNATAAVHTAWNRLTSSILVKLGPGLEKLATKMEHAIDGWADSAGKFGTFMVNHMDTLISMAKTYAKFMFVNQGLQKLTGKGIIGNVGGLAGGVSKLLGGMGFLGKFTIIGTIVAGVVGMFQKMGDKSSGIGQAMTRIFGVIEKIGGTLSKMFSSDAPIGRFIEKLGSGFLKVVEWLLTGLAKLLELAGEFVEMMSVGWDAFWGNKSMALVKTERRTAAQKKKLEESGYGQYLGGGDKQRVIMGLANAKGPVTAAQRRQFAEYERAYKAYGAEETAAFKRMKARYGGKGTTPEMQVYQDFRGSRFDITQAFSDGYDTDRVAVVFSNDIASLGERKLQSGFSPLFSVR